MQMDAKMNASLCGDGLFVVVPREDLIEFIEQDIHLRRSRAAPLCQSARWNGSFAGMVVSSVTTDSGTECPEPVTRTCAFFSLAALMMRTISSSFSGWTY